jgi:hypothetical protein
MEFARLAGGCRQNTCYSLIKGDNSSKYINPVRIKVTGGNMQLTATKNTRHVCQEILKINTSVVKEDL